MAANLVEIGDGEILAGDANKAQLVADHRLDEHGFDLGQMMRVLGLLFRRQSLVLQALGEERVPGRQLRIERQSQLIAVVLPQLGLDQVMQQARRQVVAEVKVGEMIAHQLLAPLPGFDALGVVGIVDAFALLRGDGALLDLRFEHLAGHDTAREDLLAHVFADPLGQDRVVGQLKVDRHYLRQLIVGVGVVNHR